MPLRQLILPAILTCSSVALAFSTQCLRWSSDAGSEEEIRQQHPFLLDSPPPVADSPSPIPDSIRSRLDLDQKLTVPDALHMLRLFGPGATFADERRGGRVSVLDSLLDRHVGRSYFGGAPVIVRTRDGLRCLVAERSDPVMRPERQAHIDHLLAVLAELGIPLDHPIVVEAGRSSVRELLADSLGRFHPDQREKEWSVLAFAYYLAPITGWDDKFGTRRTFDEAVGRLLDEGASESRPCAGTHALYTLAVVDRIQQQRPILGRPVATRLRSHLATHRRLALQSQSDDGSWGLDWARGDRAEGPAPTPFPSAADVNRVLATSHVAEWLILLRGDLAAPSGVFSKTSSWLEDQVRLRNLANPQDAYCPYSHSAKVIASLRGERYLPPPL